MFLLEYLKCLIWRQFFVSDHFLGILNNDLDPFLILRFFNDIFFCNYANIVSIVVIHHSTSYIIIPKKISNSSPKLQIIVIFIAIFGFFIKIITKFSFWILFIHVFNIRVIKLDI